jgi:hypothetical protein
VLQAQNVILAMGFVDKPNVPVGMLNVPTEWKPLDTAILEGKTWNKALVIGGGLTAVQAAQKLIARIDNSNVTLCSRRPLSSNHFDLEVEWYNWTTRNKCMNEFYHQDPQDRLKLIQASRNGGSVPMMYMNEVKQLENDGKLRRRVGHANYIGQSSRTKSLSIEIDGEYENYDIVILACGSNWIVRSIH